jgi:5-carboxymethyl-2-hydroxymuconic-semialdehyde dehydrogenase
MNLQINHLINGKSVPGARYFETVNPATQEVLAEVAEGGEAEVNAAVAAAKEAFPQWAATPAPERAKLMRKLGELIAAHVPEIAQTETNDCGQVISQTGKQLVPRAADNFTYFAEMCTRVDGHTYPTPTHLNYTLFHPVGVCALISPWNVPFMTATWKVAPCLAFGNTAVLKMSELSPMTAARLGELALEAGIPRRCAEHRARLRQRRGRAPGQAPRCARHFLHGLHRHGQPHRAAGGLEEIQHGAGWQKPFRDFDDADLDRALDAAVFMIFSNNGERCTAGSRILVQQSIYADFAAKFAERAKRITVGDPLLDSTIVGPMISQAHLAKVRSYIELGPKEGATLLCGGLGQPDLPDRVKHGNYVLPTVFADVDNRMRIAQEEIFGPVACLIPFKDEADAIAKANDIQYGSEQLRVDREHWPRPPRGGGGRSRHVLRQQPKRARPAPALWRHQGQRHGARRRHLELRSVLRAQERRRVFGQPPHSPLGHLSPTHLDNTPHLKEKLPMTSIQRRQLLQATALAALPLSLTSWAQAAWPTKPVHLVVPFPPGGTTDYVTRMISAELAKVLNQTVLVENKPGAGTVIGVDYVAKSTPDGGNFVTVANSFCANQTLVKKLPYDTRKDLRAVALMGLSEHVLATHPGSGLKNMADLMAAVKAKSGTLSYASFGNGTSAHLSGAHVPAARSQLYCAPTADDRDSWASTMQHDCARRAVVLCCSSCQSLRHIQSSLAWA